MFQKLQKLDNKAVGMITALHRPVTDKIMVFFTHAGAGALIWWVTLAIPFILIKSYRQTGFILITALGINYLLGEIIIKKTVGRIRPSNLIADDELKVNKPKDPSFPSGHSASSFCAFAVTAWCCPPWISIPALIVAGCIAFSRIYLRVHYLTDVVGGIILGLLDGSLTVLIFTQWIFTS